MLGHQIRLDPTSEQAQYFAQACGTKRLVYNWVLDEWNKQYAAGNRPNAHALKKQFNAVKRQLYPWIKDIHRDAHSQPFANLSAAWSRYFLDRREGRKAYKPTFKRKHRDIDSFYVANDKFTVSGKTIKLPKIGIVPMREALRHQGKIMSATVFRKAGHWYVSIQVRVNPEQYFRKRTGHGVVGVDLGLKAAATLSTGESIQAPKPLKASLRRLQIRSRQLSRKVEVAKVLIKTFHGPLQPGKRWRLPLSNRGIKCSQALARLHARIANTREDFTHKLTTRLCRENQTVVIEDLNVKGMMANEKLARAICDVGFGRFKVQMQYKAPRHGTKLILADRFYPSSRLCHLCQWKNEALTLKDRTWICAHCGTTHDRDVNAALNLKRLATATALPVANPTRDGGTVEGLVPSAGGKVTPVRYEEVSVALRGRKKKRDVHNCAHFR